MANARIMLTLVRPWPPMASGHSPAGPTMWVRKCSMMRCALRYHVLAMGCFGIAHAASPREISQVTVMFWLPEA